MFQIEYSSSDKSFQSISIKEENDLLDDTPHRESNIDGKCNELTYKLMQDVVKKIDDLALEVKDLKIGNFTLMNFSEEKKIEILSENRSEFTSDSPVIGQLPFCK